MLVSRAAMSPRGPRRPLTTARRPAALSAAFAAGALVLVGCQANPAPPPLESTSTSPTPSPSPTPTAAAPTLPADAQGISEAAAKAFVRHWIDVLNYAGQSGDHHAIREVSGSSCTACAAIADFIEQINANGGQIDGDGWAVRDVKVVDLAPGKSATIDVLTWVNVQHVRSSAESEVQRFPGGRRLKTFWLASRDSNWVVTRLDQPR
jgi:hypothetical protein